MLQGDIFSTYEEVQRNWPPPLVCSSVSFTYFPGCSVHDIINVFLVTGLYYILLVISTTWHTVAAPMFLSLSYLQWKVDGGATVLKVAGGLRWERKP